jgi:hypothetical protein
MLLIPGLLIDCLDFHFESTMPKDTSDILLRLRGLMNDAKLGNGLAAYIVPSCDAHNSEFLCPTVIF